MSASLPSARSSGSRKLRSPERRYPRSAGLAVHQQLAQAGRPGEHLVRALGQPRLSDEQRHPAPERHRQQREQNRGNQERAGEQPPELGGLAGERCDGRGRVAPGANWSGAGELARLPVGAGSPSGSATESGVCTGGRGDSF